MAVISTECCSKLFDENYERFLSEWKKFISFKSISVNPAHEGDCRLCAEWLAARLSEMALSASIWETNGGKPVVFAERGGNPAKPKILIYGHYDVQPVDPLESWQTDPFEAALKDGRLYGRGAQDNKGQLLYVLKALETLIKGGLIDNGVSVLVEGEEEAGSSHLTAMLPQWQEKLRANLLLVCDSGALRPGVPCLTMGLRGMIFLDLKLGGIKNDLHSGVHGGVVKNPAVEMARLIAGLHDKNGKIAIKGYYDGVKKPSSRERRLINASAATDEAYEDLIGVPSLGGEKGFSAAERRGIRPTVEVNGLFSGYSGPGSKTIIPAEAGVKISSRLVIGQDPARCLDLLEKHLKDNAPAGLKFEITDKGVCGNAVLLDPKSPLVRKARKTLEKTTGKEIDLLWEGASIPIVANLAEISGAEPLLLGCGLDEDRIHAPNESFSIEQWKLGYVSVCRLLSAVAQDNQR